MVEDEIKKGNQDSLQELSRGHRQGAGSTCTRIHFQHSVRRSPFIVAFFHWAICLHVHKLGLLLGTSKHPPDVRWHCPRTAAAITLQGLETFQICWQQH